MNFGEWIRKTMLEKGISEEECYGRAGMTQPNWSRLVNSPPKQPRLTTIQSVAQALDEPVSIVMSAAGYDAGLEPDIRIARRFQPLLNRFPPEQRAKAEDMAEDYLRSLADFATV